VGLGIPKGALLSRGSVMDKYACGTRMVNCYFLGIIIINEYMGFAGTLQAEYYAHLAKMVVVFGMRVKN
jgi:hypothetical protein